MAPFTTFYSSVAKSTFPLLATRDKTTFSPLELTNTLRTRDDAPPTAPSPNPNYQPGKGATDPNDIPNNFMFALFGLIGAGFVVASIWFFFWAKNGGFVFKRGDWDEYKSTVLRRKGPDGKTFSGATKSTKLGGGSIVGSVDTCDFAYTEKSGGAEKKRKRKKKVKNSQDPDVQAYRHERAAKVGGLNRQADATYTDYTTTAPSETTNTPTHHNARKPSAKEHAYPNNPTPKRSSGRNFSYTPGQESTFSVASDDSHRPLRQSPYHDRHSQNSTPSHTPRQHSPTKRASGPSTRNHRESGHYGTRHLHNSPSHGGYTEPLDFNSRYGSSDISDERGTRTYAHPIPGLSRGPAPVNSGFRRQGGGRRDSLSDSDGETGTMRS